MRNERVSPIKRALIAGYPVIGVNTWEEDQTVAALAMFARSVYGADRPLIRWDLSHGLTCGENTLDPAPTPEVALERIAAHPEPGFFVLHDMLLALERPEIQRRVRDLGQAFRGQNRFVFLLGSDFRVPPP